LYFIICFSYNFTNSAVFTSLGWMFPKRAGSALNLVLAMFGVGSFCIPLAAQACKYALGSALHVFWVVALTSLLASLPFMFVASPTPPPPLLCGDGPNPFKTTARVAVSSMRHGQRHFDLSF
jgi:nitrate/nitrite transporter NarK